VTKIHFASEKHGQKASTHRRLWLDSENLSMVLKTLHGYGTMISMPSYSLLLFIHTVFTLARV